MLKLIPGMDPSLLPWIGEHYDAVIIESYGVGGIPSDAHRDFLKEVDKLIAGGKIVVMTTQVMYEGSDMAVYEVGHVAKERYGLIESYDMTLEAVITVAARINASLVFFRSIPLALASSSLSERMFNFQRSR